MEKLNQLIKVAETETEPRPKKSEGQEKLEELAHRVIRQRVTDLQVSNISYSDVHYKKILDETVVGHYKPNFDYIEIEPKHRHELKTCIHELLHAYSSDIGRVNVTQLTESTSISIDNTENEVNVGFSSHYYVDNKWIDSGRSINEATTERLAIELTIDVVKEYKELLPNFNEHRDELKIDLCKEYVKDLIDVLDEYDPFTCLSSVSNTFDELDKSMVEAVRKQDLKMIKILIGQMKQLLEATDRSEEKNPKEISVRDTFINKFSNFDKDFLVGAIFLSATYGDERMILEQFLNYYTAKIVDDNPSMDYYTAKEEVWRSTQQAYFTGDTDFLIMFDELFGSGTLKKLDSFHNMSDEEKRVLMNDMGIEAINVTIDNLMDTTTITRPPKK